MSALLQRHYMKFIEGKKAMSAVVPTLSFI